MVDPHYEDCKRSPCTCFVLTYMQNRAEDYTKLTKTLRYKYLPWFRKSADQRYSSDAKMAKSIEEKL